MSEEIIMKSDQKDISEVLESAKSASLSLAKAAPTDNNENKDITYPLSDDVLSSDQKESTDKTSQTTPKRKDGEINLQIPLQTSSVLLEQASNNEMSDLVHENQEEVPREVENNVQQTESAQIPEEVESVPTDEIAFFINQDQNNDIKIDVLSDDEIDVKDVPSDDSSSDSSDNSSGESDSDLDDSDDENGNDNDGNEGCVDEEEDTTDGPIKSINEVTNEKVPTLPENYTVPENAPIEEIGEITGLVDRSIIIKAKTSGEFRILKEGSVLCLEDKTLIGLLYEIFGRIQLPIYTVKFNLDEEIEKFKGTKGKSVYYVVPDSQFLYTDTIKHIKGSDASNCHDEELPAEEQEFSDDEQELAAKQAKKRKKNKNKVVQKERDQPSVSVHKAHIPAYSSITSSRSTDATRRAHLHSQTPAWTNQSHQVSVPPTLQTYQQAQLYYAQQNHYGSPSPYNQNTIYGHPQPTQYQRYLQGFGVPPPPSQYGLAPVQLQPGVPQYGNTSYQPTPQHQTQHFAPQVNVPHNSQQNVDPAQLARLQELLMQQMQNLQHPPQNQ